MQAPQARIQCELANPQQDLTQTGSQESQVLLLPHGRSCPACFADGWWSGADLLRQWERRWGTARPGSAWPDFPVLAD